MVTMSAKFQKYRYKIVGGVAHTSYPLSIHQNAQKNDKVQIVKKNDKK